MPLPSAHALPVRPALAQQRDDKQAPDSADCSPAGLDTLGCSTLESVVQPNTATDPREGQYRMGLDPSGYEKFRCLSPSRPRGRPRASRTSFNLSSSTLSPSDPNQEGKFKNGFQASRLTLTSSSSDELAPAAAAADLLRPGVSLVTKPSTSVAVLSPSSTSSSSKASSTRVAAAAAPATRAHTTSAAAAGAKLREKKEREDIHSKISFSGGPSCLPRSIAKARKRSKQMPTWPPLTQQTPAALTTTETHDHVLLNNQNEV
ncbi:hypothetical protein PtB15_10B580 [Puccinia triticina]|nr:hypothetical protein PtB15_10B580 [Puccinia triticina]